MLTLAEHGKPVSRPFESRPGGPDVFVAVDSHACYFDGGASDASPLRRLRAGRRARCDAQRRAAPHRPDEARLGALGRPLGDGPWIRHLARAAARFKRTPSYCDG